ncbi:ARM repeat superfamily protein [Striga asiatica]|uniref:ARM repeat superfamily protein n=1 Tax=Striga asiatica TaxID=4170 RepID=A0A5A7P121_STRAF|nr:ARM repeat superfamily protein [Striga asiatica]
MAEDNTQDTTSVQILPNKEWLSRAQGLVPRVVAIAKGVKVFPQKWKLIISRLHHIPSSLSDLSTHPCFSKSLLCNEQLQTITLTLQETIDLAKSCVEAKYEGKLKMQSDLDSLIGKLDLCLRDCGLLIKTGLLAEVTTHSSDATNNENVRELFARLQIGDLESRHKALDSLLSIIKEDEKKLFEIMGQTHVVALIRFITSTTSLKIKEKIVTVISSLAESGIFDSWLVSEIVLCPLIKLVGSGNSFCKENISIVLKRLSVSSKASRSIVDNDGIKPLIEICANGDSVSQASAACTLKNISAVPELRQKLGEQQIVKSMVSLLNRGILPGSKEYAAECLRNLTLDNNNLKKSVVSEGGITSLLKYLDDRSLPKETAVEALANLIDSNFTDKLITLGVLPRLARVLKIGSPSAQRAAASAICRICTSDETKMLANENGCIAFLAKMLEAKDNETREIGARALASLMTVSSNCKEVIKSGDKSVACLVGLLDPNPHNGGKKYAVACLVMMSSSKRCRRVMVSYGAVGYLKKLVEMDVDGAKRLLERLEIGRFEKFVHQLKTNPSADDARDINMSSSLDVARAELGLAVLYLNKAEARDKICRAIQYGSKFLSNGEPGTAQNVDKSTSLARKVFRLFKFINDLHALISPNAPGTPLPLILLGKSKNALLSTFLFLDQIVWLGRTGIYKNKERTELIGRISLFCWLGSSVCTTLVEIGELGRLSTSMKKLEKEFKNTNKYKNEQYRSKLQKSNERTLALVKAGMDIVVAVGLLQLAPKKVTPRVTGAFGCFRHHRRLRQLKSNSTSRQGKDVLILSEYSAAV